MSTNQFNSIIQQYENKNSINPCPAAPDGSDKDCRVLLTFNHTLRDESQYHNDAVALLNLNFIDHDGITTAISEVRSGADNTVNRSCFDLQGRRVKNPAQPGVYIQNGRKHVVK